MLHSDCCFPDICRPVKVKMKMRFLLTVILTLVYTFSGAQAFNSFVSEDVAYINHTVKKSETISSVAQSFGIDSKELMKLNGLSGPSSLSEGAVLKIPVNGIVKSSCEGGDSCHPVYYTVQQSEGLYRIGKNHGNIKVSQIKQLNHLKSEAVSKGQQLLIGYIIVTGNFVTAGEPVKNDSLAISPVINTKSDNSEQAGATGNLENAAPVKPTVTGKLIADSSLLTYKGQGLFQPLFKSTGQMAVKNIAVFKSESGFSDGRFYALMDGVATGTIIKVTNVENAHVVYAKVVGSLPQVKHAENIQLRISSAAMLALGFYFEEMYSVQAQY